MPEVNMVVGGAKHNGALMLATCDVVHRPCQHVHLMLATCDIVHGPCQHVHLTEKTTPELVPDGMWVLDSGASNHMTCT
jgi:hypothetical protein